MGDSRVRAVCAALILALTGCTSSSADAPSAASEVAESGVEGSATTASTASSTSTTASSTTTDSSTAEDPLRPFGSASPTTADYSASAWISRKSMSDSSIELTWSATDDAVEYQIHRLPRPDDEKPAVEAMTPENLVHTATESGQWTDEGVVAGTRYWYGIRALAADGTLLAHGVHPVSAVTDEQPPTVVGALTAVLDDEGVLVTWTQPSENYELHGYRVLRGVDGQEPESISTTWRIEQTSFLDDDPPVGQVTYRIVAFDFHWNNSAPADVLIDLS